MSSFTNALVVDILDTERQGRGLVRLHAPFGFDYHVGSKGSGDVIEVPVGYESDLLSIPRIARAFVSPLSEGAKAAVVHDWLWDQHQAERASSTPFSRSRAAIDDIFLEAMRVEGVHPCKARALWLSVRLQALYTFDR